MLQYIVLIETSEEKPASNSGYSFLIIHQNSTSGSFLNVSFNVKSEIILSFHAVTLNYWSILHLNKYV